MKTHLMLCALALTSTAACLPSLDTPQADARVDASPDMGDTPDTADAETDVPLERFGFDVPGGILRLGALGNQSNSISYSNTEGCNDEPLLMNDAEDLFAAAGFETSITVTPMTPGFGVLTATCGDETATLEVVVLPVSNERLADVSLWSRADIGVEYDDLPDAKHVTSWRNLAQETPWFAADPSLAPAHYDIQRGPSRISINATELSRTPDRPAGLSLMNRPGEPSRIGFRDGVTILFVALPTEDGKHTITDSIFEGRYALYMDSTPNGVKSLSVSARSERSEDDTLDWGAFNMPIRSTPGPAGITLTRGPGGLIASAYTSASGSQEVTQFTPPPSDNDDIFTIERLGTYANASSAGTEFKGHIYEVLIIDAGLDPNEVMSILGEMTSPLDIED